jgi:hypothetical protein
VCVCVYVYMSAQLRGCMHPCDAALLVLLLLRDIRCLFLTPNGRYKLINQHRHHDIQPILMMTTVTIIVQKHEQVSTVFEHPPVVPIVPISTATTTLLSAYINKDNSNNNN